MATNTQATPVWFITGCSTGLGRALAERVLKHGHRVVATARDPKQIQDIVSGSANALGLQLDVTDAKQVSETVAQTERTFGRIDVLVNNAGVYGPMGPIDDVAWAEWEQAVRVNLFGSVLCCRAVLPHFRANGYGKIIQLSGGGATSPLPRLSAYAASKAAVVRFAETLAEELRDTGIDVNAVAPGALNTRLLDEVIEAGPRRVGDSFYQRALEQQATGGTPLDLPTRLVVFLASSASDGISGKLISAPWDPWEELPSHADDLRETDVYTLRRIVPADRGLSWG